MKRRRGQLAEAVSRRVTDILLCASADYHHWLSCVLRPMLAVLRLLAGLVCGSTSCVLRFVSYVGLLLVFVLGTMVWAEETVDDPYKHTVYLTNGNEMVGIVEEEQDGAVWLRVPGGRLRIGRDRIDRVDMTTPQVKAKLAAADQAVRQSRTGKEKTKGREGSSESPSSDGPMISTETPLDTLDHPTGWWAKVRDQFAAFVDRVISRKGQVVSE